MDIQKIIIKNTKDRYKIELEYTEDENIKSEIYKILNKLDKPLLNKLENFDNKMDEVEKMTMKKQFFRLRKQQKINLLKEYFKTKNIEDNKLENFAENILELIDNKTMVNKDINYDINNIKITNIDKIEIIDGELKYIKKTQKKNNKISNSSE